MSIITPYQCRFGTYRLARQDDKNDIAFLLRSTLTYGTVEIIQSREPDYFADINPLGNSAGIIGHSPNGRPMFFLDIRDYPVYLSGRSERAVYIGLLRVAEAFRKLPGVLEHGFLALSGFARKLGFADNFYTSVDSENTPLRRLVESGNQRLPRHSFQGELQTLLMSVRLGQAGPSLPDGYTIRAATPDNAPELVSLITTSGQPWDYSTALNLEQLTRLLSARQDFSFGDMFILRHEDTPVGCVGVWDQRAYRQQWIQGYDSGTGFIRPLNNLFAGVRKIPTLPASGNALETVYLVFLSIRPRHLSMARPLIRRAIHHAGQKGASVCVLGLSVQNPLTNRLALAGYTFNKRIYKMRFPGVADKNSGSSGAGVFVPQPEIAFL